MNSSPTRPSPPSAIHMVVFLAGCTFLIYEVSWNRMLAIALGATVTAATVVLSTFMAGFGVGAVIWGRLADRGGSVGRLLGALLAGVGVTGALASWLFVHVVPGLYSSVPAPLVFTLTVATLFVPTFLMGGTFPLASKIAAAQSGPLAASLGRLYAAETLGCTLGGLAAGFVLLGALGQVMTIQLTVGANLMLGVWLFAARRFDIRNVAADHADEPIVEKNAPVLRRAALIGAFACGFAALGLQVLWIRVFRIYLTNTSYTFALVASVSILALFAGSKTFEHRSAKIRNHGRSLRTALLAMAAATAIGLVVLVRLPQLLMFPFQAAFSEPLARILLLPLVASLLVVFPPAFFSGYAFPLACRMAAAGRGRLGFDVGLVMTVNTVGSVLGPVTAAFLLLPRFGVVLSILLVAVIPLGAALVIAHGTPLRSEVGLAVLYALIAIVATTVGFRPEIRILPPSFIRFDRDVLFYRETVEGTLSVGRDRGTRTESKYTFVDNSAVIGSSYDAVKVVKMVGHFPFLLGLEARDVLVIGFGIGVTTSAIASHPEVASIECVELVDGLKDAARFYRDMNHDVVNDPRLRIIAGDGRHHLQATTKTYDLISCDPTHPILGSGGLYTADYFRLCREHLNPGGMVSQYLPLHKLRTEEVLGIIRTFQSVFPDATVWLGHYHAVLLGGTDPIRVDFADWESRTAALSEDPHFYIDPRHLAATLFLDGDAIEELGARTPINTDNRSYTEFFTPHCLAPGNLPANVRFLQMNRVPLDRVFTGIEDDALLGRFVRGNVLLTESLISSLGGDGRRGLELLQEACRENPEDGEFPFLIRLNY